MKNLSEFKKLAKVGVKLNCISHTSFLGRDEKSNPIFGSLEKPAREISIVQTNAIALKTEKTDGTFVDSWFAFPKASECIFVDGKMIVTEKNRETNISEPVLTYWFS